MSRSTHPRVFDILGDSSGPFYVLPEALRAIRALEVAGEWDYSRTLGERFPTGKHVTIKRGHFAEFEAIVSGVEASGKLKLKLNIFGGEHETVVDPARETWPLDTRPEHGKSGIASLRTWWIVR